MPSFEHTIEIVAPLDYVFEFGTDPENWRRATPSLTDVAIVEHTLPPGKLASPLHRHSREDEITYVLGGRMGVQEGDAVRTVEAGEFAVKERGVWHTFWNPGPEPLRFLAGLRQLRFSPSHGGTGFGRAHRPRTVFAGLAMESVHVRGISPDGSRHSVSDEPAT
jgi:quercetin dioxygenase-like cupin family protein